MMQNVKIESIRHGWFAMRFGGYEIDCTNVFEHDTPMELLQAVYDLVKKNDETKIVRWDGEPGSEIMCLERIEDEILITVYETSKSVYDLNCSAEQMMRYCGEEKWSVKMDFSEFVDELVTEFWLYENGNGRILYEKNWMQFSLSTFERLMSSVMEISKRKGGLNRRG